MVLKEFQDPLLFAVCWPYRAKMAEYAGGFIELTAYSWAYTSYDPRL